MQLITYNLLYHFTLNNNNNNNPWMRFSNGHIKFFKWAYKIVAPKEPVLCRIGLPSNTATAIALYSEVAYEYSFTIALFVGIELSC